MSGIEDTLAGNQAALGIQAEGEPVKTETAADTKPEEVTAETPEEVKPTPEEAAKAERQKEIDEAVSKRLARERRKHDRELAELRAQVNSIPRTAPQPVAEGKPDPSKYDTNEEWVEALADWKIEERERARASKDAQDRTQAQAQETHATWTQRLEVTHKAHPDLEDLLEERGDLPTNPAMAQSVMESEVGGEILYHLAKNPEECKRIAALGPLAAARAIGAIEARLVEKTTTKEPKKTTGAPPPPTPVKGSTIPSKSFEAKGPDADQDWYRQRLVERRTR